jgi:hypothetical protein
LLRGGHGRATPAQASPPMESLFGVRDPQAVRDFLAQAPDVESILREAHRLLAQRFPDGRQNLELTIDPDVSGWTYLSLDVFVDWEPDRALEQLALFDEKWWLDQPADARSKLCIGVRFL